MIRSEDRSDNSASSSGDAADCPPSNSSSDEGLRTPTPMSANIDGSQCSVLSSCRLQRCASTPALQYTSTPLGFRPVNAGSSVQIPIVGYEVMEERARFTVYKIKIENKTVGESWFIFRRYTDFVRLNSKLKSEFPKKMLVLPRKRWFGNNFSLPFIEERIRGLQHFIDAVTGDKELIASQTIRNFFCLDEPPLHSEVGEESRAILEALEDTIYQLRRQLQAREAELLNVMMTVNKAQERAVTISQRLKDMPSCESCGEKVQDIAEDLQRALCLKFSNPCT